MAKVQLLWKEILKAVYFGMNIKHEQKHFIRATIEGIMYAFYNIGKTLEEHCTVDSLSVNGSFATYALWTQMMGDMFNNLAVKLVTLTNFNPATDVGEVLVAFNGVPETGLVMARGNFDPAKITAAATAHGGRCR